MIKPGKLNAGSVAYYEQDVERTPVEVGTDMTDYYSEHGDHAPEAWSIGRDQERVDEATSRLGITVGEDPGREAIERWFNEGVSPSGEQLGKPYQSPSSRRVALKDEAGRPVLDDAGEAVTVAKEFGGTVRGWDLMTAAPKSVSMLWGLGDDDTRRIVEQAHQDASEAALRYLARHAGYTRQRLPGHDEPVIVEAGALSGVRYRHRTSRAVEPHLHDHVLLHNRVLSSVTREWMSLDGTSVMFETKAAGMLYQAQLRARLTRSLGVAWQDVDPHSGVADLIGLERHQVEAWSTRSSEISSWLEEKGLSSDSAAADAQKATRDDKDLELTDEQLREQWRDRAAREGIDAAAIGRRPPSTLQALTDVGSPSPAALGASPTPEAVLLEAGHTRSTFTRSHVVQAAAALLPPEAASPEQLTALVEDLADQALTLAVSLEGAAAQGDVVTPRLADGRRFGTREGSVRYATREMIELEASATARAGTRVAGLASDPTSVRLDSGLSLDQLAAVRSLVGSDRRVSVLIAPAGAGKTTSLRTAREVWEGDRRTVRGLAATGKAVQGLVNEGAAADADTIATVLGKVRRGEGPGWRAGDVILVDEAGMVGSMTLATLIEQAEAVDARLVLIGDPHQLQPVAEAAGLFELLADDLPDTARLGEVWRQVDEGERTATLGLRGDATEVESHRAVKWYYQHDRLSAGDVMSMAEDALTGWALALREEQSAVMLTPTWEQADGLNLAAQRHLINEGTVDHSRTVKVAELDDDGRLVSRPGMQAGVGDLVMAREGDYSLRTSTGGVIRTGQVWQVAAIEDQAESTRVTLQRTSGGSGRTDTGESVTVPAIYLAEHARLGYAMNIHQSQGITVDAGFALLDSSTSDQNSVYTAMTRGRLMNQAFLIAPRGSGHPDDEGKSPERFRLDPLDAGDMLVDITARSHRDRAAHHVLRDAAQDAREEVATKLGPDEAQIAMQRAALTHAAQADADRLKRTQQHHDELNKHHQPYQPYPGYNSPGQNPRNPGIGR